jgi:hypothetical protein
MLINAPTNYAIPPQDLLLILVQAYFSRLNLITPLLHHPTFERALAEGAHHSDSGFCVILLLVCANGARFVDDDRVLIDGTSRHSAGWKWFSQAHTLRRSLVMSSVIQDLQCCCVCLLLFHLYAIYPDPPSALGNVSAGLRHTLAGKLGHCRLRHSSRARCRCAPKEDVQRDTECGRRALAARILVRSLRLAQIHDV